MSDPDVIFVVRSPLRRVVVPRWSIAREDGTGVLLTEDGGRFFSEEECGASGLSVAHVSREHQVPRVSRLLTVAAAPRLFEVP